MTPKAPNFSDFAVFSSDPQTRHLTIAMLRIPLTYIQRGIGGADRSMYLVNEPSDGACFCQ